ncbi:cardiolipin synthetase 2 [Geobacter sp. DSM 9736]|nr:cardiolipin synthetase 2 [Geobacter sp. DSM 9736]
MDNLLWALLLLALVSLSIGAAGHALLYKRDPRSAMGWIGVCITLPLFGPFFYWVMGVNRITRKARQWLESGRRLTGCEAFASREPEEAGSLPAGAGHLEELRALADRVVTCRLTGGSHITPLHNGEGAYPLMVAAIDAARHSVHLSTYIFDGDATGSKFIDALRRAAERGVEVRVIVDSLGEKYSRPTARKLLKGTKVKVGRFLPLRHGGYLNLRNHRKILVVDGNHAFTGGMNIGDRHVVVRPVPPPTVVDLHFLVEGPVVADLQRVFLEDWYFVAGEILDHPSYFPELAPAGGGLARVISDGPDKEFRKLHWILMGALACATRSVRIMTPYFIPDRSIISALITCAMRGVDVTLVLPAENNLPFVHWATRSYLWELLQLGIRVFYQPPPFVHTKLFVVDGLWSLIGSANLDPRSLRLNFELNLEVYDRELGKRLSAHFEDVLSVSQEVTLEEMDARPLPEKIRDCTAKLFSPYL